MLVRIYYSPEKDHPAGMITSHPSGSDIIEMDTIEVDASGSAGIKQVDLLAEYTGYDENGDGIYLDWHRNYHTTVLAEHIGSAKSTPYRFIWDNLLIPNQEPGSVSLLARIQDNNGVWFVTEIADSLSLVRPEGVSVKMFTAENVPQKFWVRANEKKYCDITIDDMSGATNALLMHRTWNGRDGGAGSGTDLAPLSVNSWRGKVGGVDHNYYLSKVKIPVNGLITGKNRVGYHSDTEHHGIEILWPGPAILVRYNLDAPRVETPFISPSEGEYQMPLQISITCATPGADIYYTTTGSDPNVGSRKYTSPFNINDSSTVRAMSVRFDFQPSETAHHKYSAYQSPQLMEVYRGPEPNTVIVEFNKPVEVAGAEEILNYSLDNSGIITNATLDTIKAKVILEVEGMYEGEEYTITVNNIIDDTGTSIPSNSSSTFTYAYNIELTASFEDDDHPVAHSMDGDLSTYWSANGTEDVWIQYDLRRPKLVQSVDIAFFLGDTRQSYFSIQTSTDGIGWTEAYNGASSGNSLDPEQFDIDDVTARYVRILGLGNSGTSNWNSYTEVQINWQFETLIPDYMQNDFHVYPVPAVNEIYVRLPSLPGNAEIFFVNALGQSCPALWIDESSRLSTSHLNTGMHLLMIKTDNQILQKKIMVVKE